VAAYLKWDPAGLDQHGDAVGSSFELGYRYLAALRSIWPGIWAAFRSSWKQSGIKI